MTRRRWATVLAGVGLVVTPVAALATWALGFAVLTTCTNDHSCSQTACAPCRVEYLTFNAVLVVLLLAFVASLVLLVAGLRRSRRSVR